MEASTMTMPTHPWMSCRKGGGSEDSRQGRRCACEGVRTWGIWMNCTAGKLYSTQVLECGVAGMHATPTRKMSKADTKSTSKMRDTMTRSTLWSRTLSHQAAALNCSRALGKRALGADEPSQARRTGSSRT